MTSRWRHFARRLATGQPLVCIGHSHISNVASAAESSRVALKCLNFWQLYPETLTERADGSVELLPEVCALLRAPVFSFIGGSAHHFGVFAHPRPYDFVMPGRQELPFTEGAELVPYDAIQTVMQTRTRPFLAIMRAVRAAIDGPMFHMESPPTFAHEVVPPDANDWAPYGVDESADPHIAPVWLRYKLWRVHSELVRNFCRDSGITFVPHPSEAVDSQGLLAERFHGALGHANRAYGALVLQQMQQLSGHRPSLFHRLQRAVAGG